MAATEDIRPLLKDVLGDFAHELTALLTDDGEADLATQVPHLRLFGRCRCGDEFCATVYTAPRPEEAGDRSIRTYPLIQSKVFWFLTSSTKKSSVSKFFIVTT
jgi:hypothetical protein